MARRSGQICRESHPITDTKPAALPPGDAVSTHSQICREWRVQLTRRFLGTGRLARKVEVDCAVVYREVDYCDLGYPGGEASKRMAGCLLMSSSTAGRSLGCLRLGGLARTACRCRFMVAVERASPGSSAGSRTASPRSCSLRASWRRVHNWRSSLPGLNPL